jgi:DNA-binding response OmpR family regulator
VIVLSAQADEKTRKEAIALGARAVLNKPFGPLDLLQRIENIFES